MEYVTTISRRRRMPMHKVGEKVHWRTANGITGGVILNVLESAGTGCTKYLVETHDGKVALVGETSIINEEP